MDQKQAEQLLEKFKSGRLSEEETALLESWYLDWKVDDKLDLSEAEIVNELNQMRSAIPYLDKKSKVTRLWPRIAAAASILLCLGLGLYYYDHKGQPKSVAQLAYNDIAPGSNKAILTLANGKRVILTGARNGTLAAQGNTAITKKADGEVIYNAQAGTANATVELVYNTVSTPRGGQYQVVLPDGSHVWLNAASSIRFPTAFTGKDREVAITGEAYFEVAHNKAKPFRVSSNGQTVEVLGTHFNINAYSDEPAMKTTLLEGSVRITKDGRAAVLKPGEQATIANASNINIKTVNTEEVVAWKEGLFQFKDTDLPAVMRQLSRWYDVEISYEGAIPRRQFNGDIHRNLNASKVLDVLSFYKVHFRIEGKKIIVKE